MTVDFPPQLSSDSVPRPDIHPFATSHQTAQVAALAVLATGRSLRIEYTSPEHRAIPLAQLRDWHINYTAIVPLFEIPSAWHAGLWAYARNHPGRCYDATDVECCMLPAWRLFLSDPTPETVVVALRRRAGGENYPDVAWRSTGLVRLPDYLDVLQALRFLACGLPEGTLAWHRVAIRMRPANPGLGTPPL